MLAGDVNLRGPFDFDGEHFPPSVQLETGDAVLPSASVEGVAGHYADE